MEFRAHLKNAQMSPRKVRLVRSVIRGLPVQAAVAQLTFMPGKASGIVLKVLRSALANAKHNFDADESALVIDDVVVNEGMVLKRFRPVSKGMAHPILKRMSHVTVVLGEHGAKPKSVAKRATTEITDISAADHIVQGQHEVSEEAAPIPVAETVQSDLKHPRPDKQQQTYQKMKAQQQGGDRGKTHRRKSLSEG